MRMRFMNDNDVAEAMELKNIAGWNQTVEDWHSYLLYEPNGCFVVEINGKVVATATCIAYKKRFGWIGMILVHPNWRRRGIASRLMKHCIKTLQNKGVATIKLDATAQGKPVYEKLGFITECRIKRYAGVVQPKQLINYDLQNSVELFSEQTLADIIAFDEGIFQAPRDKVLEHLYSRHPELCLYTKNSDGINGYIMGRKGYHAYHIGPWIAVDEHNAEDLLITLLKIIGSKKVVFDSPSVNPLLGHINQWGFQFQREFVRMYLGEKMFSGKSENIYAISEAAKG